MRLVIVESPFAGDGSQRAIALNVVYARRAISDCLERNEAPIASHLLFTQPLILRDDVPLERKRGMQAGLAWYAVADAVVFYLDRGMSPGMQEAAKLALQMGKSVEDRYLGPEISNDDALAFNCLPFPSSFWHDNPSSASIRAIGSSPALRVIETKPQS